VNDFDYYTKFHCELWLKTCRHRRNW